MNRRLRRPLLGVVAAAVVIGSWLGAPLLASPAHEAAQTGPSAGPVAAPRSARPSTSAPTATARPVASGPAPSRPPVGNGTFAPPPIRRGTASATPLVRAALDARLEALRRKVGIPGISATILFADGSVWEGAAGLADVAADRRVTTDTAFPIASASKTFTSALVLGLIEDGKLRLDSTVKPFLPGVAIDPAITVRELLDHTSGLRDFYFGAGVDKALLVKRDRVWDAARSLAYVGKPFSKPGLSWHYSNTNYLLLGMLAEAVERAPVAAQLRARFLTPLGLDHTYYQFVEAPLGPTVHDYTFTGAKATLPAIDLSDGTPVLPFTSVVTAAGAAGSIATTSADLARWARALYGGSVLDAPTRAEMVGDIVRTAGYQPAAKYGLGVQLVQVAGHPALGHSGRFLGARAVVRWLPDLQVAIAVLTNQSRSDPGPILTDLLKLALRPQSDCITCPALP
ncbi:MAG: D-alanyl-D-alanine carboxypeptidase [Chloroflexota bacterium]|nr:D-alanyl-D-alanine carboxypeptidase [Chloroflexota bacterium]